MPVGALHLHIHFFQQVNEVVYVQYIGNVAYGYGFIRQQYGTDNLKCFVFCALGYDLSF